MKCVNCDNQINGTSSVCGDCLTVAIAPSPRDRELAILRAQVRVLVQWACCPRTAGLAVDCPEGGECDCYACTERVSRQQAEKEVDDGSVVA